MKQQEERFGEGGMGIYSRDWSCVKRLEGVRLVGGFFLLKQNDDLGEGYGGTTGLVRECTRYASLTGKNIQPWYLCHNLPCSQIR